MELYILIPGRKENRFRQQPLFWCITYYTIYVLHISFLLFYFPILIVKGVIVNGILFYNNRKN